MLRTLQIVKIIVILISVFIYSSAYDEKFDRIDIEYIITNETLHKTVNNCILGVISCGPYWDEVRENAKEIANDQCAHCTMRQKIVVKTYVNATKTNYPDMWRKIRRALKNPT